MEDKLNMIKRYEKGEKVSMIARVLGLPRSTVSTIIHDRQRILAYVTGKAPSAKTAVISVKRGQIFDEMERLLTLWIEHQTHERIPTSQVLMQEKAKSLFQDLLKKYPDEKDTTFIASSGWFARFKRRFSLHNIKIQGEAAFADPIAIEEFPITLQKIIEAEGFLPEQIFNVDETGLFWKRLPDRSFISKEEMTMPGYKVAKERLTLMLGGNCTGDFKLKPLLVYHAANPRALKNIPKASLPVIWMNNIKAWVTVVIFEEWFIYHFIPAVKNYCREKNIPFKVLLILDNAPGHPTNLGDFNPNVKVLYLPSSLIQPMDQGVMTLFKRYYLRRTLRQAVDATSEEDGVNLRQFWKNYNIYQAVLNISAAWSEVTQSAMNEVWKYLCPQFVNDFKWFDTPVSDLSKNLVSLSADLEMELEEEDFESLIEADKQPLSNEDLIALGEQRGEDEVFPEPEPRKFSVAEMQKGFYHLSKCLAIFEAQDPNAERFAKIMNGTNDLFLAYRTILNERKKCTIQGTLDQFPVKVEKRKLLESSQKSQLRLFCRRYTKFKVNNKIL